MELNVFDQFDSNQNVFNQLDDSKNAFDQFDKQSPIAPQKTQTDVPKWGQQHPNVYGVAGAVYEVGTPLLEGLGLAGGAIIGTGVANPIGGAGAGYAIAEQANQLAGEFLGVRKNLKQSQRFKQLGRDVAFGAMLEMGGQIANKFIFEPIIRAGKWTFGVGKSYLTGKAGPSAYKQASRVWKANTSAGPIYATNKQQAKMIEKEVPGLKFTEGQKTYDPRRIKFERVAFRKQGSAGVYSVEQQAANDVALKSYYQKNFGGDENIDEFIIALNGRYAKLQGNIEVVKKAGGIIEGRLEGGDVQQIHKNIVGRLRLKRKMAREAAEKVYKMLPENIEIETASLMKNYDAISMKRTAVENPDNIPDILKRIKSKYSKKVPDDLKMLIKGFKSKGRPVPQQLLELESEYGTVKKLPFKEIKGIKTEILNELRIEQSKQAGINHAKIGRLSDMLDVTENALDQLKNVEIYGENVSGIYKSASAKWKFFRETYDSGTVGDILQKGTKGEVLKLTPEQSLSRIFNAKDLRAADRLNVAVGKSEATKMVRDYADYDLMTKTKSPITGEVDSKKLARWLYSNSGILKKYGLGGIYKNLSTVKESIALAEKNLILFEKSQAMKMLGVDPDKAVSVAFAGKGGRASAQTARELLKAAEGNPAAQAGIKRAFTDNILKDIQVTAKEITGTPVTSVAKFNKIYAKYEPALKEFYRGQPEKIRALKNMKKAYEIMIRNKTSPIGGGSDTFENTITALYSAAGHAPVGGPMKIRALRSVVRILTSLKQSQVEETLARAIFDPEVAQTLEMIASGMKPEIAEKKFAGHAFALIGLAHTQLGERR